MIKLIETLRCIILEGYDIETLKQKYVNSNKIDINDFNQIISVTQKLPYQVWLLKILDNKLIKNEDIYKYKDYLNMFTKHKSLYPIKDISQINNSNDLTEFIRKTHFFLDQEKKMGNNVDQNSYVGSGQIKRLDEFGIKYLGISEGYQVFKVPHTLKGNYDAWVVYKNILGRCTKTISICTIASFDHFNSNFHGGPYYVLFNMSDPLSPYQFNYESNQFMDRADTPIV